jgi:uncharacterized repeat protein (TIGR01451 family)
VGFALFTPVAQAAGLVTVCTEAGLTSAIAGGGTVKLGCDGTITLTSTITINADTTIDAGGRNVILSGGNAVRLFIINSTRTLTLRNLTLSGGKLDNGNGAAISNNGTLKAYNIQFSNHQITSGQGGALYNTGNLEVYNSFFTGDTATNGGAIANAGTSAIIQNSTFAANNATVGGAIYNISGLLTITNSTFANNSANDQGGAITVGGGTVNIASSTLASNQATNDAEALNNLAAGTLTIVNTLIYKSATQSPAKKNCLGTIVASGANLQFPAGGGCGATTLTSDPLLASLSDNGGPTQTIALQANSPAINAGSGCPTLDQRYAPRVGACDLGAFEFGGSAPSIPNLAKAFTPGTIGAGGKSTVTFTVSNLNTGVALTNIAFVDILPSGMTVAVPNTGGNCPGTVFSIASDNKSFGISNITSLAAGSSCTVTIDVTSSTVGNATNTVERIFSSESGQKPLNGGAGISASLTVFANPGVTKSFTPAAINLGGTSTLKLVVSNPNGTTTLNNISFSDTLPTAITFATPDNLFNGCLNFGGNVVINSGVITVSGINLPASQKCTISVDVTSATLGSHTNSITSISSTETQTATINTQAVLNVVNCPNPLTVTSNTDDSASPACGGIRFALSIAGPGDKVLLQPSSSTIINLSSPINLPAGVSLIGRACTAPVANTISLVGDNLTPVTYGLKLNGGGTTIQGIKVSKFNGPQIQARGNGNRVLCSQSSRN